MNPRQQPRTTPVSETMPRRAAIVGALVLLGFGGVWARLHHLQISRHELVVQRVETMHRQKRVLSAHRGAIRDCNGEILASDKMVREIVIDLQQLGDLTAVRQKLSRIENTTPRELSKRMTNDEIIARYREHVIGKLAEMQSREGGSLQAKIAEITKMFDEDARADFKLATNQRDDEAEEWERFIDEHDLLGVLPRNTSKRAYPCADRLTHVIGYTDRLNDGVAGIESYFDNDLRGIEGFQMIERDRKGREVTMFRGETVEPKNGCDVILTIDLALQELLEEVLESAVEYYHPRRIMAGLMEPKTGIIRAMASRPHLNRADMSGDYLNHVTSDTFEPGSVFKIVAYTAALDRNIYGPTDSINCDADQKLFAGMPLQDHASGRLTVTQAFAKSSNHAAVIISSKLGEERYADYLRRFGFGAPTGIPLPNEAAGDVKPRPWHGLTFSRTTIGHEMTVTSLQMALATSAIANGGKLMKPILVSEVRNDRHEVVSKFTPQAVRQVCSEKTANTMRQLMEAVVGEGGTGKKAAIPGVRVAGKTGTAQIYKGGAVWSGHHCVSFTGFAPAENPEFCAIVTIDNPNTSEDAGPVAGPVFADLMKQSLEDAARVRGTPAAKKSIAKGGQQ